MSLERNAQLKGGVQVKYASQNEYEVFEAAQQHKIHIDEKHEDVSITISGGVACFPSDASTGEQLLRIADEVLYSAKHKGRNKIYRRL